MSTRTAVVKRSRALIIQLFLCVIALLFSAAIGKANSDFAPLLDAACVLVVASASVSLWTWRMAWGSLFNPFGIFLVSAILFNLGQVILSTLHLNDLRALDESLSDKVLIDAVLLSGLGVAFLELGALASFLVWGGSILEPRRDANVARLEQDYLRIAGWTLFAISVVPAAFRFRQAIVTVRTSGYLSLYQQDLPRGVRALPIVVSGLIITSAVLLLLGSRGRKFDVIFAMIVIVFYCTTQFFLGYRAYGIMPVIAVIWTIDHAFRKVPRFLILWGSAFSLVVLFPLIGAVRNSAGTGRTSFGNLVQAYLSIHNPVIATVGEMGGSMITTAYTLELVPSYRPYDWGYGYLQALISFVPVVNWKAHPLPSTWLVWTVDPARAARGGGLGYSFIAEAYLNFGWVWGLIAVALIGFWMAAVFVLCMRSQSLLGIAFAACVLMYLPQYARGSAAVTLREIIWYAAIPTCIVFLLKRWSARQARVNADFMKSTRASFG